MGEDARQGVAGRVPHVVRGGLLLRARPHEIVHQKLVRPVVPVRQADELPRQPIHRVQRGDAPVRPVLCRDQVHPLRPLPRPPRGHPPALQQLVQADAALPLLRDPDRARRVLLKTPLRPEQGHPHRARVPDPAELVDAADAPVRHPEQRRLVAEDVPPPVGLRPVDAVLRPVHDPLARHVGHARARDRDHQTRGVRGIVHGRYARRLQPALPPAPSGDLVKPVVPVVIVLRLPVHHLPERPLRVLRPAVERRRVVITRLPQHVDPARLLHRLRQIGDLLHADPRRHGGVDVLARPQGLDRLRRVQPVLRDQDDRVHVLPAQVVQRGARPGDAVPLRVLPQLLRVQVAQPHLLHQRVRPEQRDETLRERPHAHDAHAQPHVYFPSAFLNASYIFRTFALGG